MRTLFQVATATLFGLAASSWAAGPADDGKSGGSQWGVINLGWNGALPSLAAGNLKIRFIDNTKIEQDSERYIYSFMQEAVLPKKPKSILASACSIVENLDTNGGDAGVLHLPETEKIAIYMRVDESFLVTPRVCLSVQY